MNRYELKPVPKLSEIAVGQTWTGNKGTKYDGVTIKIEVVEDNAIFGHVPGFERAQYMPLVYIRHLFTRHE